MSSPAVAPPAPAPAADRRDAASLDVGLLRPVPAVLTALALAAALASTAWVRRQEAALSATVADALGVHDVRAVASTVLFQVDGHLTGYTLTPGCSVVFLLLPFAVVTTVLMGVRRVPVRRAAAALLGATAVLVVTNQVRIAAVAVAMHHLGPLPGYSLTHVFVGALVSTLGAVVAGCLYLVVLVRGSDRRAQRPAAGGPRG